MTTALEQRLKKLSRISEYALLGTDGFFYVFGNPETVTGCLYADGHLSKKPKQETVVITRKEPEGEKWIVNTKENVDYLTRKAITIHGIKFDEPVVSFNLPLSKWEMLNKRIKDEDASHIQIECDGKEIRAYFFDVR